MRSILVFFLWIIAVLSVTVIAFVPWLFLITIPGIVWHTYRDTNMVEDDSEWLFPWFPVTWVSDTIKKLDKNIDIRKTQDKMWIARNG